MGDPYFDLASVALFFVFDPKDEEIFLESYFGVPPTLTEKNRLYLMKQVALCFYGLALLGASHSEQQSKMKLGHAIIYVNDVPATIDFYQRAFSLKLFIFPKSLTMSHEV